MMVGRAGGTWAGPTHRHSAVLEVDKVPSSVRSVTSWQSRDPPHNDAAQGREHGPNLRKGATGPRFRGNRKL